MLGKGEYGSCKTSDVTRVGRDQRQSKKRVNIEHILFFLSICPNSHFVNPRCVALIKINPGHHSTPAGLLEAA